MSEGYERHRPNLPRTYHVFAAERPRIVLGPPVVDALDAEPGDAVEVGRNDRGEVTLAVEADR